MTIDKKLANGQHFLLNRRQGRIIITLRFFGTIALEKLKTVFGFAFGEFAASALTALSRAFMPNFACLPSRIWRIRSTIHRPIKPVTTARPATNIAPIRVRQQDAKQGKINKDLRGHPQQKLINKYFNYLLQFCHVSFFARRKG